MRNFHRDFESLNSAYLDSVRSKEPSPEIVNENVSEDIARLHRDGSIKQLREALKMLAAAHHRDHSTLTQEDVYNEMKLYAEENLTPAQSPIPAIPAQGPSSELHNTPVPVKGEGHVEEGTGSKDHEWDEPHRKADREKFEKDPGYQQLRAKMQKQHDDDKKKKEEKSGVEETNHATLRAAQTDEENAEDDRKKRGLESQGKIMKKDLEDEEKESGKKKVGENFDKMLELLKLSDQVQNESDDEEDEDEDTEGLEEDIGSFMKKQMQPGGDKKAQISSGDINMAKDLATAAGGPTGNMAQRMMGKDGPTKIRKAYGNLMGAVADKLTKATKELSKNNPG